MPPQLGNFLPPDYKKKFVDSNFREGAVFKLYSPKAGKEKRFILVSFKYDKTQFASVFINTDINPNIFNTANLKKLHLLFLEKNCLYLDRDSHVDCSQLIFWEKEAFIKSFEADLSIHIGAVTSQELTLIKSTIKTAYTISPSNKKEFGLFL